MSKILYYGGNILTMDKSAPRAEAMLSENGRIVALGRYDDLKDSGASLFDLEERTLMPAFVDGHSHAVGYGVNMVTNCDLTGCTGFDDLLSRIRTYREEKGLTHGESISCRGYDPAIIKEGRHPDAKVLDVLGDGNPIRCIHQSGHISTFNTAAMKRAGVLDGNYVCPSGGFAGRDENGILTGYFEETACTSALSAVFKRPDPKGDMREGALLAQELYIKNGFTTVQEGSGIGASKCNVLGALADEGRLKLDVVAYMTAKAKDKDIRAGLLEKFGREYRNHLKIGGVKTFLDGSPQAKTAWLSQPYEGESEYCGYPRISDETARLRIGAALDEGLQIMAHCNGDAASEQFISAFEAEARKRGLLGKDLRPVMIHAQTVRYDQLERMKRLGMMASFFIGHCYFWGGHTSQKPRRARYADQSRTACASIGCSLQLPSGLPRHPARYAPFDLVRGVSRVEKRRRSGGRKPTRRLRRAHRRDARRCVHLFRGKRQGDPPCGGDFGSRDPRPRPDRRRSDGDP